MPVSALKESDLLNRKGSFSEEGVLGLKNMALVSSFSWQTRQQQEVADRLLLLLLLCLGKFDAYNIQRLLFFFKCFSGSIATAVAAAAVALLLRRAHTWQPLMAKIFEQCRR